MKKEKWIDEILATAKEIRPVESNPYLASRIDAKLNDGIPINKLSLRWVFVSAALILLTLNIMVWRNSIQPSTVSNLQQLIQEYGWASTDLYSTNFSNPSNE